MKQFDSELTEEQYEKLIIEQSKQAKAVLNEKYKLEELLEERNQYIQKLQQEIQPKRQFLKDLEKRKIYKILRSVNLIQNIGPFNKEEEFKFSRRVLGEERHIKNYKCYDNFYQDNMDFREYHTDIKPLAFYLPQFHSFKENDEWWGKGFTEWTNTKKSNPRFEGHYQPREPHDDIGYYELTKIDVLKKQIELAKKHGIYGFCFYYYWFSGKRLMEKPVDLLMEHPEVEFPFCLCWANENWTRTWDGMHKNVLIAQDYSKSDYKKFIIDLKKYVMDPRYIRIDGKPLIMIYNPYEIPNLKEQISEWKKFALEEGIGEIFVLVKSYPQSQEYDNVIVSDGEFEFAPYRMNGGTDLWGIDKSYLFDYKKMIELLPLYYKEKIRVKPYFYCCTMGWDNSARRQEDYTVYCNYSPKAFYDWIKMLVKRTREELPEEARFIFVNAWNEWAEGTYLEPDKKYGYTNINTLSRAIFDLPYSSKKDKKND